MTHKIQLILSLFLILSMGNNLFSQADVTATVDIQNRLTSMNNGIVSITINSKGQVNSLLYNGKDLIDANNQGRFYFSYNDQNAYSELSPDKVRIEKQTADYVEVVYSRTTGTLLLEQAFIMQKGVSGIHSYITVKGTSTPISLREMRVVYRVNRSLFDYGYVSDVMQGELPSVAEMVASNNNSIMDATYELSDGSIYTKYDWANYLVEDDVHGILSDNEGVWAIAPSNEFMNGGPMKQELTVHATNKTPLVLQMLQGEHFGAASQSYSTGTDKIYGPFFIYVNSGSTHQEMIDDAKVQAGVQKSQWPYQWLDNPLFPINRTEVSGTLNIPHGLSSNNIQVVLAKPGTSIYNQGTDYMFWSKTDSNGEFTIPHVRDGAYTLYAYATEGEITEELTVDNINVSGASVELGTIDWPVEKLEKKFWQIGENDRLTKGFKMSDTPRAYGLYDLPPSNLEYTIGSSTPENDWYYAQTKVGTWTVNFNVDAVYPENAVLTASIAGAAANPKVDVYVNGVKQTTWSFGNDASVYRSAVLSGRHEVRTLTFPASYLNVGSNTISFKMTSVGNRGGLMYDCVKLEAGELLTLSSQSVVASKPKTISQYPNPFKSFTDFKITANNTGKASLCIYGLNGQLVDVVFDGHIVENNFTLSYDGTKLKPGLYIYKFKTDDELLVGKLVKK